MHFHRILGADSSVFNKPLVSGTGLTQPSLSEGQALNEIKFPLFPAVRESDKCNFIQSDCHEISVTKEIYETNEWITAMFYTIAFYPFTEILVYSSCVYICKCNVIANFNLMLLFLKCVFQSSHKA